MSAEDDIPNEMSGLIDSIGDTWRNIYETLEEDSSPADPYLNGATHDDIGESILTILVWMRSLGKVKKNTPKTHRLARAALLAKARSILNRLKKIEGGEYTAFGLLMADISVCLSNLAAATIVSRNKEEIASGMSIGGLAQSLAELENYKTQVSSLLMELSDAVNSAQSLERAEAEAKANVLLINQMYESAKQTSKIVEEQHQDFDEALAKSKVSEQSLSQMDARAQEILAEIERLNNKLEAAADSAEESSQTIKELLPQATSAGLAASFGDRAALVSSSIKVWAGGFLLGIFILIAGIVGSVYFFPAQVTTFDWLTLVRRLVFAAPGVWLAWYCARGMSTAIKLRESYAFKEAMSRAFEGYKNQMLDLDSQYSGSELAAKLSESVLAIMATDPIAILSKPDEDGHSPWEAAYRRVSRRSSRSVKKNIIISEPDAEPLDEVDEDDV